jgi:hypothetical protein
VTGGVDLGTVDLGDDGTDGGSPVALIGAGSLMGALVLAAVMIRRRATAD